MKDQKQKVLREKCDCFAQQHELINNCLSCGKIVCAKEGEGPCLYCGTQVSLPDGQLIGIERMFALVQKQEIKKVNQERSRSILHKNKLIQIDQSTEDQKINDEQLDYHQISQNQWISEEQKKHAINRLLNRNKQIDQNQTKVITYFDPLTQQFVQETLDFDQEGFKKEAQNYIHNQKLKQALSINNQALQNWNQRILKDQKMKEIYQEVKIKTITNTKPKSKQVKLTELLIEQ